MYLENKQISLNTYRMIAILGEQIWVEEERTKYPINHNNMSYQTPSQVDKIKIIIKIRTISLHNHKNKSFVKTENKIIIDQAIIYVEKVVNDLEILKLTNHVCQFKKVFLPFKLVGSIRRDKTEAFINRIKKIQIR